MTIEQLSTEHEFYRAALELRYELFFKEYGLPRSIVIDEIEPIGQHFGITQDNNLLAYGRLTDLDPGQFKISQVVVRPSHQGKGYGRSLLRAIIEFSKNAGAKIIELNSQASATALYESIGFQQLGNVHPSRTTGVAHVKMVLGSVT